MSAAPVVTALPPTLPDVLRAFNEPFGAACNRWAIKRAIGYLTDGTAQGRDLALDVLRATQHESGEPRR